MWAAAHARAVVSWRGRVVASRVVRSALPSVRAAVNTAQGGSLVDQVLGAVAALVVPASPQVPEVPPGTAWVTWAGTAVYAAAAPTQGRRTLCDQGSSDAPQDEAMVA